jgi:hypothetical protein
MIVRELTTLLGFKIEDDKIKKFDTIVNVTKNRVNKLRLELEGIGRSMQKIGGRMTLFLSTPLAIISGLMIKTASDAEETRQKFSVVFRSIRGEADAVADSFAEDFGLARHTSKELLGATGDLLTGFGFTQEAALELSEKVQRLGADLASFQNTEGGAREAGTKLTKGILGETENLKLLGIAINQGSKEFIAHVKQIMAEEKVTERQAKVLAIFREAVIQSKNAVGDFARTSKSFANQWKVFKERLVDVAESFGVLMIPMATAIVRVLVQITKMLDKLPTPIKKVIIFFTALVAILGPIIFLLSTLFIHLGMTTVIFLILKKVLAYFGLSIWIVFKKLIGVVFKLSKYLSLLRYSFILLSRLFMIILARLILITAVMTALSYAIHLVYDDIKVWTEGGDSLIGMLLGSFTRFKGHVLNIFGLVKGIFKSFWKAIRTDSRKEWDRFKALFGELVVTIGTALNKVYDKIDQMLGISGIVFGSFLEHFSAWVVKLAWVAGTVAGEVLTNLLTFIWEDITNYFGDKVEDFSADVNRWFTTKFPGLSKFLLTEGELNKWKPGSPETPDRAPPGMIGPSVARAGVFSTNFNVKSTVNLTVPEGTKKEQADYVKNIAKDAWSIEFKRHLDQSILAFQQIEK